MENRDRYQPGLGSQPERAVALGWKEVDYYCFFFFTNSKGRIWGIVEDNRDTCGLDPSNMQGSKTQQKLDDINDKKRGDKAVIEVRSHVKDCSTRAMQREDPVVENSERKNTFYCPV